MKSIRNLHWRDHWLLLEFDTLMDCGVLCFVINARSLWASYVENVYDSASSAVRLRNLWNRSNNFKYHILYNLAKSSTSLIYHSKQSTTSSKIPTTKTILLTSFLVLLMTSFLSRLTRPFSSGPMAASMTLPEGAQKATVAAGCFWGVEHMFRHTFANKGLIDARVGYIGGDSKSPSYRAVCSGRTGRKYLLIILDY
jgi:hypothetical protein